MTGTNFTNSYQMTESDIGKGGWNRDGDVLWAPDSKRFAYFSSDLTPGRAGGLREQTAIFQLTGQPFGKVELSFAEKPGIEGDAKLRRRNSRSRFHQADPLGGTDGIKNCKTRLLPDYSQVGLQWPLSPCL